MIISRGTQSPIFLWFIPDDWTYKTEEGEFRPIRLMVSGFISFVATFALFALWARFGNYLIEKQQKDREARISLRMSDKKRDLRKMNKYKREETFAELRRRKEELDKLKKKSPFQEEESIVLERLLLEQLLKESNKKQKKENNIFEELDEQEESL
jgi:hypothetical protein